MKMIMQYRANNPIAGKVIGLGTAAAMTLLVACSEPSEAGEENDKSGQTVADVAEQSQQAVNRQWLIGMVEGAYLFNPNLNNFAIDVDANGNTVVIEGAVEAESERALAEEIALSIDGVEKVDNRIRLEAKADTENQDEQDAGLRRSFSDATITTRVKTRLLANSQTSGFAINVDTDASRVTLRGDVKTDIERDLAYYIAKNTEGVNGVDNQLKVVENEQVSHVPQ